MTTTTRDPQPDLLARSPGDIASFLRNAAAPVPNKSGIIFNDQTLTYLDRDVEARRLALRRMASGVGASAVGRGDRHALPMHSGPELAIRDFACCFAGAIATAINRRLKAPEIDYGLKRSGVRRRRAIHSPGKAFS